MSNIVEQLEPQMLTQRMIQTLTNGVTLLVRGGHVMAESATWDGKYQHVQALNFRLRSEKRPFIGVSPASARYLTSFLRPQEYVGEEALSGGKHALYLDQPQFSCENERALPAKIEQSDFPLIRLPAGQTALAARSALPATSTP